ncbi:uncharacterized protein LOC142659970 isoform X2 [Rhinoderma darwinii]|uniref:uncharacterized protein LOC142659970 isoform X2 n=1 Tax=Rhinoderma darwinii TaxID=43563 RepID=UPI003F66999A
MSSRDLWLFSSLLCLVVAAAAVGEPSCADVEDFGICGGATGDFCPRDIACSCKAGRPFCSCPNYRGPNGNYWYLGEKCDQLWSTLDMIAMCVFPGVALAFVVGVTAQLIHFCKTKPKSKTEKEPKKKSERETTNTHQNQAFIPEVPPRNQYEERSRGNVIVQAPPTVQTAQWNVPAAEPPNPRRLTYYSEEPSVNQSTNYFERRQQSQNTGFRLPEQDYEPRGQQQYSRFSAATHHPDDHQQRAPEPSSSNTGWANRPFSFGRPQLKTTYDY